MLIAVFDTNMKNQEMIRGWLAGYAKVHPGDLFREAFVEDNVLQVIEKYAPDIHLAAISLDGYDGAAVGQKLYALNPDCRICYYSASGTISSGLLRARPIAYHLLPLGEDAFCGALDMMIRDLHRDKALFRYETKSTMYCWFTRTILYFRSELKHVFVHRTSGEPERIFCRLTDIEHALDAGFLRIHKSFIVNPLFIASVDKRKRRVILANGEDLPISDAWYEQVIESLSCTERFVRAYEQSLKQAGAKA